jgi:hypothetical protein
LLRLHDIAPVVVTGGDENKPTQRSREYSQQSCHHAPRDGSDDNLHAEREEYFSRRRAAVTAATTPSNTSSALLGSGTAVNVPPPLSAPRQLREGQAKEWLPTPKMFDARLGMEAAHQAAECFPMDEVENLVTGTASLWRLNSSSVYQAAAVVAEHRWRGFDLAARFDRRVRDLGQFRPVLRFVPCSGFVPADGRALSERRSPRNRPLYGSPVVG